MYVWWLTQAARAILGAEAPADLPNYVRTAYRELARTHSPRRVYHASADDPMIAGWDSLIGQWLDAEGASGILVKPQHVPLVVNLPGIVTDLNLVRYSGDNP